MITPETLTHDAICDLRDSQPVTEAFKPIYNECVRALGTEPTTGGFVHPRDRIAAKRAVCDYLNSRSQP